MVRLLPPLRSAKLALAALPIAMACAAPAAAESGAQIAIHGEVAPRCWVADPATVAARPARASADGRAICNQAPPRLVSKIRALQEDGTLADHRLQAASALSARTALEIVVSPQV